MELNKFMSEKPYVPSFEEDARARGMMSQEEMDASEKREQEAISTAPILLMYRDNDLFSQHIPGVVAELQSLGRFVEVQSLPAGTPSSKVREWSEQNAAIFRGKLVLTDGTCGYSSDPYGQAVKKDMAYLDRLFSLRTQRVLLGEHFREVGDYEAYGENIKHVKSGYLNLLRRILEGPEHMPEKVIIVRDMMLDHEFRSFRDSLSDEDRKLYRGGKTSLMMEDNVRRYREICDPAVSLFRQWLIEAGVPEETIEVTDNRTIRETAFINSKLKQGPNLNRFWIFRDRHNLEKEGLIYGYQFQLPLSNFLEQAREYGLVDVKPDELEGAMNQILREDFGQKGQKGQEEGD